MDGVGTSKMTLNNFIEDRWVLGELIDIVYDAVDVLCGCPVAGNTGSDRRCAVPKPYLRHARDLPLIKDVEELRNVQIFTSEAHDRKGSGVENIPSCTPECLTQ